MDAKGNNQQGRASTPEIDPDVVSTYIDGDTLLSSTPCLLFAIIVAGTAAGENTFTLRDGHNTTADIMFKVTSPQNDTVPVILEHPIRFNKGLYADETAGTCYATIQYKPDY